jgi:hypothetical protein
LFQGEVEDKDVESRGVVKKDKKERQVVKNAASK